MNLVRCSDCGELAQSLDGTCMEAGILMCPYHPHWIRHHATYRACPACHYCVRCKVAGRPSVFPHRHNPVHYQLWASEVGL